MIRLGLVATLALSLTACSTTKAEKPPVCDGKHRRPANLYGTVIAPEAGASTPSGAPEPKPQALSSRSDAGWSCA